MECFRSLATYHKTMLMVFSAGIVPRCYLQRNHFKASRNEIPPHSPITASRDH
jgi:hypothetical protein